MTESRRTRRAQDPTPLASAAVTGEDREVTAAVLAESIGPDPDHEKRLDVAHRCAERFAGHTLPKVLGHDHAQGVQRLAEWLAFTGRGLDGELPAEDEIPAVVRYHWRLAGN
jgi:hypothetical protein